MNCSAGRPTTWTRSSGRFPRSSGANAINRRFGSSGGSAPPAPRSRPSRHAGCSTRSCSFCGSHAMRVGLLCATSCAVDGKPRRAADRPLQGVLKSDSVTVDQLKRLAAANGRFNIGSIVRTFNEPTLALLFLDAQYRAPFAPCTARRGEQTVNGEPATMYEFVEQRQTNRHSRPGSRSTGAAAHVPD